MAYFHSGSFKYSQKKVSSYSLFYFFACGRLKIIVSEAERISCSIDSRIFSISTPLYLVWGERFADILVHHCICSIASSINESFFSLLIPIPNHVLDTASSEYTICIYSDPKKLRCMHSLHFCLYLSKYHY